MDGRFFLFMLGSVPDIDSSSRCRQAGSREVPPLQWVIVEVVGVQDAADGNARGDRHRGIQALAAIRIRDGDGAGRGRCRSNDEPLSPCPRIRMRQDCASYSRTRSERLAKTPRPCRGLSVMR